MSESLVQETVTEQQSQDQATSEVQVTESEQQPESSWFWAEGVPGQGDVPEWMVKDKYKSVADQAKSYKELLNHHNERLKGFIGAPEGGYDIGEGKEDDPLVGMLTEIGSKYNMNQDMFNELVEKYSSIEQEFDSKYQEQEQERIKAEVAKLGENADYRLKNIADFAKGNFDAETAEEFIQMATTAKSVEILEQLISKSKGGKVADPSITAPVKEDAMAKMREMQFATDENGRRLIEVDMNHRQKYEKLVKQLQAS